MLLANLTLTAGMTFANPFLVDYLIVAGGGAGGSGSGAGGGGLVYSSSPLSRELGQSYTITVGAAGSNSAAFGVTAYAGGASSGQFGNAGGSGSGGGRDGAGTNAGGLSTQISYASLNGIGLGNSGGSGTVPTASGGGGGAGAAGANGSGSNGGNGGDGYQSSITGTAVYYAGGGGGGGASVTGAAGLGTGVGSYGGGSQGQGLQTATQGVVILRYADTSPAATTTGSPTITVAGGYRVYTFTGDGTITFN